MKGINNRQKMIVRPRESVQKYLDQQKTLRRIRTTGQKDAIEKRYSRKAKPG